MGLSSEDAHTIGETGGRVASGLVLSAQQIEALAHAFFLDRMACMLVRVDPAAQAARSAPMVGGLCQEAHKGLSLARTVSERVIEPAGESEGRP